MILRTLLIAWQHALKFKLYSIINLGGLAIGLASSIIILQYVTQEFSYDSFHQRADNVYRLNTVTVTPAGVQVQAAAAPMLAPTLMSDIPEVETATRLRHADDVLVQVGEYKFYETKVFYADSNFFKVLTFPVVKGNAHTALSKINTAVITTEFAKKYFGEEDPINRTIVVGNILLQVTGVADVVKRSHFEFDILISFETFTPPKGTSVSLTSWEWTSFPTYVRLHNDAKQRNVEAKFPTLISRYRTPDDALKVSYQLQPIKEVYLHSRHILERDGISIKGDYLYTVGLMGIAGVIMSIACFNFTNLSTTLCIYRIKETGVKRSLGSSRREIFLQFMLESLANTTIGLVLGILLHLLVTGLALLPGADLSLALTMHLHWAAYYVMLILIMGGFAGFYPAILLARLTAPEALKGKRAVSLGSARLPLRKSVIVFQFFITTVLIVASLTIKRQMDFMQAKALGYDKSGVVVVHLPDDQMRLNYSALRNKLARHTTVMGVSASRDLFDGQQGVTQVSVGGSDESHMMNMFRMYPNFIETMGIRVLAGKPFAEPFTDSTGFILNESAVKMLGWKDNEALSKTLYAYFQTGKVIAVVEDFHFASLHSTVGPLIMLVPRTKVEYLYIRVSLEELHQTLAAISTDWRSILPQLPFEYVMLDDHVQDMYKQEEHFSRLTFVFCGLSVALACLGLFGITSVIIESRIKEIGIRKVLGASVYKITMLLTREFMLLVLIAGLLALPASFYLLKHWLQAFAYKTDLSFNILAIALLASFVLALIGVGFKSVKAAHANPVQSLKGE